MNKQRQERVILVADNLERLINHELDGLTASLENLEKVRESYEPLIPYAEMSHLTPEFEILSTQIGEIKSQITKLETQKEEIARFRDSNAFMPRGIDDWVIIAVADEPEDISKNPWPLNLALSLVLGLMIGAFAVCWSNNNFWV